MPTTSFVFLSLAVSQLLVLGLYIILYHRRSSLGLISACLVITLVSSLIGEGLNSIVHSGNPTLLIFATMGFNRIGNIAMFLTCLLSLKLFDDNFAIRKVHPGIWILAVTSLVTRSIGSYYAHYEIELSAFTYLLTWGYSQLVLLGFSIASIYVAVKGYRTDLVVERRHERVIFVICAAFLLLMMAGNRGVWVYIGISEGTFQPVPLPQVVYSVYAYFATVALFLWKFRAVQLSAIKSPARIQPDDTDEELHRQEHGLSTQIQAAMEEEKLYREPSLTVPTLAERLTSQEYLVRRSINNHMGYRNFSTFLNHYRIAEAEQLLTATKESITNIGFNVGYMSLSSFFTAFRSVHGVTPKQYREKHI